MSLALDIAFIDGSALTVTRLSQPYDQQGPGRLHYVDLACLAVSKRGSGGG